MLLLNLSPLQLHGDVIVEGEPVVFSELLQKSCALSAQTGIGKYHRLGEDLLIATGRCLLSVSSPDRESSHHTLT